MGMYILAGTYADEVEAYNGSYAGYALFKQTTFVLIRKARGAIRQELVDRGFVSGERAYLAALAEDLECAWEIRKAAAIPDDGSGYDLEWYEAALEKLIKGCRFALEVPGGALRGE